MKKHGNGGIRECTSAAVAMKDFLVSDHGSSISVDKAAWIPEADKAKIDKEAEIFIGVKWYAFVDDQNDGYSDKSLTTVPLVAYTATDKSTYKKVRAHFKYNDD